MRWWILSQGAGDESRLYVRGATLKYIMQRYSNAQNKSREMISKNVTQS